MKNKIFKNKDGGGIEGLKYLLDKKRVAAGTAKVLRGNPKHTESLIKCMRTKQKTTMGVLSFEETCLDEDLKEQLMTEFEELIFPGMDPSQYHILWVEHTDKNGRIELNYLIVKLELTTARPLQPYYYKVDYSRVDAWERLQNLKYSFTDPLDPSKARTIQGVHPEHEIMKEYMKLDIELHGLVDDGELNSRNDIIGYITDRGDEVTHQGKDYISVKLNGKKKAQKFKIGTTGIYSQAFTSRKALVDIQHDLQKAIQNYIEGREEFKIMEIPQLEAQIEKMKEYKEKELLKKYPRLDLAIYHEEIIEKKIVVAVVPESETTKEEIINNDRIRISKEESDAIRERVRVRTRAKRKRSEAVYKELEEVRRGLLIDIKSTAREVHKIRRGDAERLEENTRTLIVRVQEWSKREIKHLTDEYREAFEILGGENPYMSPEIEGEKGPKIRPPGG